MSIENLLAGTNVEYSVKDGVCYIKAKRCRTRVNKSDNPERDIMSYINSTGGCKISALCRHTGHSRYRIKQIVSNLCDAGKAHTVMSRDGVKSIIVYPN